jgi:hypothetical protein
MNGNLRDGPARHRRRQPLQLRVNIFLVPGIKPTLSGSGRDGTVDPSG